MAQFGKDLETFSGHNAIKIIGTETNETYTVYIVEVTICSYTWTVKHRYSDFHDIHEKLCSVCKLDKNLLPPKKLFGNQSESFIKKRQTDLEVYLQTVLYYTSHKLPSCLAEFLNFSQYEIHGITQGMAEELYNKGDLLLHSKEAYRTTPLHLYALTERLKLPEPTCESGDVKRDIGHILDFITRLKCLQVCGGQTVGTSNIDVDKLPFDLTLFKSLQTLEILTCDMKLITGLETVKQTLKSLIVNQSLTSIQDVLLQDMSQWKADDGTLLVSYWDHITHLDLSHNTITTIEDSLQLMPRVVQLDLAHNHITTIQHLQWLSHMTYLDLSHNAIACVEALHSKIGNLKTLKLAGNKLDSLKGLSKLFSLETLDISHNQISEVDDIKPISGLPCVEKLLLLGNPVTITLDYRTKTLAMFGDRVKEVCLDKEVVSQQELDTVAVLQAIQKSREKAKHISVRKAASSASLTDLSSSPSSSYGRRNYGNPQSHTSGNHEDKPTPLMQKFNLFNRKEVSSRNSGVNESPYTSYVSSSLIGSRLSGEFPQGGATSHLAIQHTDTDIPHLQDQTSSLNNQSKQLHLNLSQGGEDSYSTSPESRSIVDVTDGQTRISALSPSNSLSPSNQLSPNNPLPSGTCCVNIATLPDHKDNNFNSWLYSRLFGESGKGDNLTTTKNSNEGIHYILWCPVVQYSCPCSQLPCCVVLTERRIFILQLKNKTSHVEGVPELETFYILPLCNIQQVLIGLCYSFIRLEESFIGASGTFALLVADSDIGKDFYEVLNSTCAACPENGDLDVVNSCQVSDLSKQIFDIEEEKGECTGRIAFAAHVKVVDTETTAYLVLSENQVYIIKSCILFWPKPTFDTDQLETERQFEIAQQFSVEAKISEIQRETSCVNEKDRPVTPTSNLRYQQYVLSMMFHEILGSHKFNFSFLSAKARDTFLDRLTNLRSEHAHRMSPTTREEPEGGNESSESSEDNQPDDGLQDPDVAEDSDGEYLTGDEAREEGDKVTDTLAIPIQSSRKLRSKTELIISNSPALMMVDEQRDLPSYTWHYLSPELTIHLESCIKDCNMFQPLSHKLHTLTELNGEELTQYFHTNIVPVGVEGEELHHIVWTNVLPYTNPKDEIVTCVMLSNRAVYFVSDRHVPKNQSGGRPSWMTHARHVSDSVIGLQTKMADSHHSAGILLSSEHRGSIIKPYCILDFSEIQQINVGLFDQCVRLTGSMRSTVFTVVTRNSEVTSLFLRHLSTMLSLYIASPMLDKSSNDLEQDFYKAFDKRTKTTVEGTEYIHPSKVKFCYPGDEAISDLLFIINEHLETISLKVGRDNLLQYILGYRAQSMVPGMLASILLQPISIILTKECLCFVTEDLVSYPLPDFVRGLPGTPRQNVTEVKKIEYLKYVNQSADNPRDVTLVFSDEKEDIVLVLDHYSVNENGGRNTPPEIPVRLFIQNIREMSKFLLLLKSQWKEKHPELDKELLIVNV